MDEEQLGRELDRIIQDLSERHRDLEEVLLRRFTEVNGLTIDRNTIRRDQAIVIGAYFCEEYSFEAAALFNPSIVLHPDQSEVPAGTIRFILSLRGIGEGHVSSITFRTGTWASDQVVTVDPPSATAVAPRIEEAEAENKGSSVTRLHCGGSRDVSETVLFPVTPSQRQGIEDLRLVRFTEDDGAIQYLGTYTAFSGAAARSELLRTDDFRTFEMRALEGSPAESKGMALFPRRIDGRYMMLGRQDNENIWLHASDDLYSWKDGNRIIRPEWTWEFVQMGNCGSPIEIDEGWLVITHGVGAAGTIALAPACSTSATPPRSWQE